MEWQLFEHWLSELLWSKFDTLKSHFLLVPDSDNGPVEDCFWPAFALTFQERFLTTGVKSTLTWGGWSTVPHRASQPYVVVLHVNGSHLIKNYLITFLALISGAWLSLARVARLPREPFHPRDPTFFPLAQTLVRYPAFPPTFLSFTFAAFKFHSYLSLYWFRSSFSSGKNRAAKTSLNEHSANIILNSTVSLILKKKI